MKLAIWQVRDLLGDPREPPQNFQSAHIFGDLGSPKRGVNWCFGQNPDFGTPEFPEFSDFFYRNCQFRQIWENRVFRGFLSLKPIDFDAQKPEIWGSGGAFFTILDDF
jgi:hypothetical protein